MHAVMQILPHGIEATRYQPAVVPLESVLGKSFVFLFNGGLLPRKGIDILLQVSCHPRGSSVRAAALCLWEALMIAFPVVVPHSLAQTTLLCLRPRMRRRGFLKHCGIAEAASSAAGLGKADRGLIP